MYKKSELENLVLKYPNETGTNKKKILEDLLLFKEPEKIIYGMVFGENSRASLRLLCDLCRKKIQKDIMKPFVIKDADKLLGIDDDKARKNACILIGLCAPDECAKKLRQALINEKIRFVRPSIILALGNTSDPAEFLKDYIIEPGEPKHVREEAEALKKALSKSIHTRIVPVLNLPEKAVITYISRKAAEQELKAKKSEYKKSEYLSESFDVKTSEIKDMRCYSEALFYIGDIGGFEAVSKALDNMNCRGLDYRIEAGNIDAAERNKTIRNISEGLSGFGYYDNPSAYSFEIRVFGKKLFVLFPEKRFEYRKMSLPASINPVTAASIMRLCLPYMKENASVLDPFCGSATMLIERGYIKSTSSLVGVDISPYAIKAANENRKASGLKIGLIKGDILGFGASRYDEIISNMPFGLRVSGHNSNIKLYKAFADKLDTLLKEDGVAFLFTQEKNLLRDVLSKKDKFSIVKEEIIETGGLYPSLFIIERKKTL